MVTPESAASRSCLTNLDAKPTGKPIAGNRHDGFEVAETGNRLTVRILRHSQRKRGAPARPNLRSRRQSSTRPGEVLVSQNRPDLLHLENPSILCRILVW